MFPTLWYRHGLSVSGDLQNFTACAHHVSTITRRVVDYKHWPTLLATPTGPYGNGRCRLLVHGELSIKLTLDFEKRWSR